MWCLNSSCEKLEYHVSLMLDQYVSNICQMRSTNPNSNNVLLGLGSLPLEVTLIYFALFSALSFVWNGHFSSPTNTHMSPTTCLKSGIYCFTWINFLFFRLLCCCPATATMLYFFLFREHAFKSSFTKDAPSLGVQTEQRRRSLGSNQKRTPSCHWCFASNSNGGFLGVVV